VASYTIKVKVFISKFSLYVVVGPLWTW